MIFNSMVFLWLFLPVVFFIYYLLKNKYKNEYLVIVSFIFYAWGEPKYIILILLSILINYAFGILIYNQDSETYRKSLLILSLICNFCILAYFKYFNFVVNNFNELMGKEIIGLREIVLPIGISFYTFQAVSYLVDIYRSKKNDEKVKVQTNIINFALYIMLFPKLTQGPIVKYYDFDAQIRDRQISVQRIAYGIKRFILGMSKKVLVANTLGVVADDVFGLGTNDLTTQIAWLGIVCYSLQIYFDFSGYSDMAIGLGEMLGFTFMENFNYPYISRSLQEFWRRWHISLSTWFKEYLYIPLGGNRKGDFRTYINLFIVFFLTGLWHGAGWHFIIWGLFHGIFLIIERMGLGRLLEKNKFKLINHIYTVIVVMVGWVFFKEESLKQALKYIYKMFVPTNIDGLYNIVFFINPEVILILVLAFVLCGVLQMIFPRMLEIVYGRNEDNMLIILSLLILFSVCIVSIASSANNPFIYFKF